MTSHAEFGSRTDGMTVTGAFPDVIKGKTVLITGVSPNGLGMSTAEALASQEPALLILTGRSREKVQKVIDQLSAQYPTTALRFLSLDLSSLKQVREAAREVMAYSDVPKIDIVICNAGIMAVQTRQYSEDDIEIQLATNHLGHFLFVNLIMEKLIASATKSVPGSTRIINVSSRGHFNSPIRFSDLNFEREQEDLPLEERANLAFMETFNIPTGGRYNPYVAYGQSKAANVLFTLGLNIRLSSKYKIRSYALHPGAIWTDLWRHSDEKFTENFKTGAAADMFKTLEQGCSTTLVAALDPDLTAPDNKGNAIYLDDCHLEEPAPFVRDPVAAEKLWKLSEKLVGRGFSW